MLDIKSKENGHKSKRIENLKNMVIVEYINKKDGHKLIEFF